MSFLGTKILFFGLYKYLFEGIRRSPSSLGTVQWSRALPFSFWTSVSRSRHFYGKKHASAESTTDNNNQRENNTHLSSKSVDNTRASSLPVRVSRTDAPLERSAAPR